MSTIYYTSKLGNKYPKEDIEKNHENSLHELSDLRSSVEGNSFCADCGQRGTIWSSVNIGVFLCLRCGSYHRALGTHISKPKGCTGTYLWGPDEVARMREMGNIRSNTIYGGTDDRPSSDASDSVWLTYLKNKYEKKLYAPTINKPQRGGKLQGKEQQQHYKKQIFVCPKDVGDVSIQNGQEVPNAKNNNKVPTTDLLNFQSVASYPKRTNSNPKAQDTAQKTDAFFADFGLS